MPYVFSQLAQDWDELTNVQREALFQGTNFNNATLAELQSLGSFKILCQSDTDVGIVDKVKVKGVHNDFLVLPNSLFGASFHKIKAMNITESISDTTNAKIRYILTKDLENYYTLSGGTWTLLNTVDASSVISSGISGDDLDLITSSQWAEFFNGEVDHDGIGIGFAFCETALTQTTAIDNLALTVDMVGLWSRAEHTVDYTYGYTNTTLNVSLLTNGDYKINYGGGGSGSESEDLVYATDSEIDALFN